MGYSVRFACRVVGVSRAAYYNARKRHQEPSADKYAALRSWLVTFAGEYRRWGYRRAWVKARQAGFTCGRDVVRRLWRQEGLRVFPRKAAKRRCLPVPTPRTQPAACPGQVWALDFQFDSDYQGKTFKICNVIDEFTREHVGFEVARSITATAVIDLLENLAAVRGGRPRVLRMDNGPEFISHELTQWAAKQDTIEAFIPPGMPWHNGFVESFHNRLRDELLEDEMFDDPAHASHCLRLWSERYNTHHPHSSLGFIPPTEYANQWHQTQEGTQTDRS
ncbi:integrase catalytic region [Actinobaculum suis]|uniref:Integrase catalytic region n=1 Tax=Actinobaculum suis TaxID=1657 RepID=A0A7Z8Y6Z7_9ACTO|nr:integrase catalytic region [Actinobaculum suis]VDG76304.1 integrase catalytic region [Actinobaculum suis]